MNTVDQLNLLSFKIHFENLLYLDISDILNYSEINLKSKELCNYIIYGASHCLHYNQSMINISFRFPIE